MPKPQGSPHKDLAEAVPKGNISPYSLAEHCGAKKRNGEPCRGPAMKCGRCRMHGGMSTGPKTPEGLERCRMAPWKHGRRSASYIAERKQIRDLLRQIKEYHPGGPLFERMAAGD